jgi:hypothetical protein
LINDKDKDFLLDGIQNGFRIIEKDSSFVCVEQKNHKSCAEFKREVESELLDQIEQGNYIVANRKPAVVSALAAIPKEDKTVRIIHDGSRPHGQAMNDYAIPEKVKFQTLTDACKIAKPGYWCAKVDLKAAYRSVCIHPDDYNVTGLKWTFESQTEPTYLFDSRLPFGSKVGPSVFHRLSQAIRRCMARRGMQAVVSYLDDFFLAAETKAECQRMLQALIRLLRELGFNISWHKVVGPTQRITFLGVDIDTSDRTLSLGDNKVQQLQQKLQSFANRKRASKRQLQSLCGSLNWASYVVRGGRFFLRRILDSIKGLRQQQHKIRLSSAFHADLQWWLSFLHVFNGTVYFHETPTQHVYVDACNTAAGAFYNGDWFYMPFACDVPAAASLHINFKEVVAAVEAMVRWVRYFKDSNVVIHTDSTVAKAILNKGRSTNPYINCLLRKMAWVCARQNCNVRAVHVSGSINIKADTISRLHEKNKMDLLICLLSRYHRGRVTTVQIDQHMSKAAMWFLIFRWCIGRT